MYISCRFDEVSAIRWSKMTTFSITGSQIFFANFVILPETNENLHTGLSFTTLVFVYKKFDKNKLTSEEISKILSTFESFPKRVCTAHVPNEKDAMMSRLAQKYCTPPSKWW